MDDFCMATTVQNWGLEVNSMWTRKNDQLNGTYIQKNPWDFWYFNETQGGKSCAHVASQQ